MSLKLNFLLDEGIFIPSTTRPDCALPTPPLVYGSLLPIELYAYTRSNSDNAQFESVDLSGYDISLSVGDLNSVPMLGFATVTFEGQALPSIPVDYTALQLQELWASFLNVSVSGQASDWIVTFNETGSRELPTIEFSGSTTVTATVEELNAGSDTVPAQWRILVMQSPPAGIVPTDWVSGSVTPSSSISGGNKRWQFTLDKSATTGFYFLEANGNTTNTLSLGSSAIEIQNALDMINCPCSVLPRVNGGFSVVFRNNTTLSLDDSLLEIPFSKKAVLNLNTPGIRELLDGSKYKASMLSISIEGDNVNYPVATIGVSLSMPIASTVAAAVPIYQQTAFYPLPAYTGLINSLEALHTKNIIKTGSVAFTTVNNVFHTWQLCEGTDATNAANGYVRPIDYNSSTNARVWVQIA